MNENEKCVQDNIYTNRVANPGGKSVFQHGGECLGSAVVTSGWWVVRNKVLPFMASVSQSTGV